MVTAGGLVFIGAAMDNYLRAYDLETGSELWKGETACRRAGHPDDLRRPGQAVRRHCRGEMATWEPPSGTTSLRSDCGEKGESRQEKGDRRWEAILHAFPFSLLPSPVSHSHHLISRRKS